MVQEDKIELLNSVDNLGRSKAMFSRHSQNVITPSFQVQILNSFAYITNYNIRLTKVLDGSIEMGEFEDDGFKKDLNIDIDVDIMERSVSSLAVSCSSDSDWRTNLNPIRSKLEYALKHGLYADLTCLVGSGKQKEEIKCHSLVLRLQSGSFDQKYGSLTPGEVELPLYEPASFRQFLLFLYTEKFNATVEEAISLLFIAKGFEVNHLVERCAKLLRTEINVENASVFYMKANEYKEYQLEEHAKAFILNNADAVFQTAGFLQLSQYCLETLLKSAEKSIDEISAFKAMLRWAHAECERENLEPTGDNLQYVLKSCIELISYNELSAQEFSEFVVDAEIMPAASSLKILKELTLKGKQKQQQLTVAAPFSRSRSSSRNRMRHSFRSSDSEEIFTLDRYKGTTSETWSEGGIEKISFKCSKTIQLVGVGLYGRSTAEIPSILTHIILSTYDEVGQLATCNKTVTVSSLGGIFVANLDQPVTLAENVWYTLTLNMEGEMYPFGTGGKKEYKSLHFGNEKVSFEFKNPKGVAGASTAKGQIPQLFFKF